MSRKDIAIIVAGGSGKRFGLPLPKQYYKINSRPIWYYTLDKFIKAEIFSEYIIVVSEEFQEDIKLEISQFFSNISRNCYVVIGGKERYHSVFNALNFIKQKYSSCDEIVVSVHDAVRPLVEVEHIIDVADVAYNKGSAVLCCKSEDTLKIFDNNTKSYKLINRDDVIRVQTPQSSRFNILFDAYSFGIENKFCGTDESSFLENFNQKVEYVFGNSRNIKLTTQDNLQFFQYILSNGE